MDDEMDDEMPENMDPNGQEDVVIKMRTWQMDALGYDSDTLANWIDRTMGAIVALRTGDADNFGERAPVKLYQLENGLDAIEQLIPRLEGVRAGILRKHREMGGSLSGLAKVMNVARSTAQDRRTAVEESEVGPWEHWASDPL